jgi:DNA-binding SARP family transcriptional activator
MRLLLGLLIANSDAGLTRDQAIDVLWPEADPSAAVNSLNQTVFQLRRLIEPGYREGESPQYIVSTVETVRLNRDLVETDLIELRHLVKALHEEPVVTARAEYATRLVDLIRGEFLSDLKYEDWVASAQLSVHAEVRAALLPIAMGEALTTGQDAIFRAGCALALIDPYDEAAQIAMAKHLAGSGRRTQARSLISRFAARLKDELDEDPSDELKVVGTLVGADLVQ